MSKYKPKPFYPPQAEDFILVRRVACLSRKNVSKMLHVTPKTVENWELGKVNIPYSAFKLLKILTNYELPGNEWEGWSIRGNALYSPTGRSYRSHELYYIGNMFQMARIWIAERKKSKDLEVKAKLSNDAALKMRGNFRIINGGIGG